MGKLALQSRPDAPAAVSPAVSTICCRHLQFLLTDIGLWQHTDRDAPNPRHGYSIDDEARGLIVGLRHWERGVEPGCNRRLAAVCFRFLEAAAINRGPDAGRFHNFCDAQGTWLDPVGSDDSFGRTLWGLGVAAAIDAPFAPRNAAEALLARSLARVGELKYLRARAFVILGLAEARLEDSLLRCLANALADAYESCAGPDWRWFENQMTYCNARLPHALFAASEVFPEVPRYREIAVESLDFLLAVTRNEQGSYAPVGNAPLASGGWFNRGEARPPLFDQQPVDAGALVECCAAAYHATHAPRFLEAARNALQWYVGRNFHGLPVYNPHTGAVADALTRTGLNRNQGAESVLSFHLAVQALQSVEGAAGLVQ